jgi:hypothetical protein
MHSRKEIIFIHSMFRTGSSYLYSLFREDSSYYCYYEPLNEHLLNYTQSDALKKGDCSDFNSLRHKFNDKNYFYEFPYNDNGIGVKDFDQSFSFKSYFLDRNDKNDKLFDYIEFLKNYANARVVYQFCRSALRTGWFKNNFNSLNIYLVRDPRDQWMSYSTLGDNNYFNITNLIILCSSQDEIVKNFLRNLGIVKYESSC